MVLRRLIFHWISYALILAAPAAAQYDSFRTRILTVIPSPTGGTTGELRFAEQRSNGTNYVGFRAAASIGTSGLWTLPSTDGASGNCIAWASSWTLGWAACAGGGGGGGITSLGLQTGATQSFANANDTNVTLSIGSSSDTHTFTLGWTGTLAKGRQNSATVYNDGANTYSTGAQNFAAASSLTLPVGAGAAPTTSGQIAYDSTGHLLKAGFNGSSKTIATTDATVAKAGALSTDPTGCTTGQFVTDVADTGTLTCATPSGSGNVNGPATHGANYIPVWDTANSRNLLEGLAYSQSATNSSVVQRDGSAGIAAAGGSFTTLYAAPGSDTASLSLRRNNSSQTAGIAVFATEGGTELSRIDKDGNFTGRSATTSALASDPAACSSGQFVTDIAANGTLTCSAGGGGSGNVSGPGASTLNYVPVWANTSGTSLGGGLLASSTTTLSTTVNSLVTRSASNGTLIWDAGGTVIDCRVYGVRADGSTDDATAIENCINALPSTGGEVLLPEGDIYVASTVDIGNGSGTTHSTRFRIKIRGRGRGSEDNVEGDSNALRGVTRIRWNGGSLSTKTISGATNTTPVQLTVTGHGFTGGTGGASQQLVMIDGAGKSGTCSNDSGGNGVYQIRVVDVNTLELRGSTGNGTYNAACPGTLYYGDPVFRVNGPVLDVSIEDLAIYGNASTSTGAVTGTMNTATTAAVGVEWRNVNGGGMKNVSITRVGVVALNMRAIDGTSSNTAYFSCNASFEHIEIHAPRHQRTSGIHLGGYEVSAGADTCSNRFDNLNVTYGGGVGSYGINAGFADNNYFSNVQVYAIGNLSGLLTPTGGNWWRDTQVYHLTAPYWFPTGNVCDKCYASQYYPAKVDTTSTVNTRMLWLPNYGEQELMAEVPPITQRNIAGISDTGRFWNGYTQHIDGSTTAPAYSFAQDTNTGLWRPGSDQIGFVTGGTERVRLGTGDLSPISSGGIALGTSSLPFAASWSRGWNTYTSGTQSNTIQADAQLDWYLDTYSGSNGGAPDTTTARRHLRRSRCTLSSPCAIVSGDRIGTEVSWGYSGGFQVGNRVTHYADTVSGVSLTTSYLIGTTNAGSTADRVRVDQNGLGLEESTTAFYLGPSGTDGSWRIIRSGNNLIFQRREAGSWVTKSTIPA